MINIVSQISVHQEHEFLVKLEAAGLTGPLAQKVIESRGNTLAKDIVALIRGPQPAFPSYTVLVDYGQTVERLIRDGRYDWANDSITPRNFSSSERGNAQIDIFLLDFDRNISSEDAIREMEKQGLRPATLKELLALGSAHPDLQRENPIVALGSRWRFPVGLVDVPYLGRDGGDRRLFLGWFGGDWYPHWRFAAVRRA